MVLDGPGARVSSCRFEGFEHAAVQLNVPHEATVRVQDTVFEDNTGASLTLGGVGEVVLTRVTARRNTDSVIDIQEPLRGPTVRGSTFEDNGGEFGVINQDRAITARLSLERSVFRRNVAGHGAVLYLVDTEETPFVLSVLDTVIEDTVIEDNVSTDSAGVIYLRTAWAEATSHVLWRGGRAHRNQSTEGGVLYVYPHSDEIEITIQDLDIGAGADDNTPFDLEFNGEEYAWPGVISARCEGGEGCRAAVGGRAP